MKFFDELGKTDLFVGICICVYFICFVVNLATWIERGCVESFFIVLVSTFACMAITVLLCGCGVALIFMLIKLFLD